MIDFFYSLLYMLPLNIAAFISILTYNQQTDSILLGCIFGSAVTLFALIIRHVGNKERILISGILLTTLIGFYFAIGEDKRARIYEQRGFLLLILGLAIAGIIVGRLAQGLVWMKIAIAVLLIVNAVYMMVSKISIPRIAVVCSFFVIALYLMETIQRLWKKSGYTDVKQHMVYVSPIVCAALMVICFVPTPNKPYDWRVAKDLWKMTVTEYKRVSGYFTDQNDEYKYTGFSEEASWGGSLGGSDTEVMIISNRNKEIEGVYLGGIIFDEFIDNSWKCNYDKEDNHRFFDLLETRMAIDNNYQGFEQDYIKDDNLTIENRLYATRHMFIPNKTNLISKQTVLPKHVEREESLLTTSNLRYGDTYSIYCAVINQANPDLIAIIDTCEPIEEQEWNDKLSALGIYDRKDYSFEKYKQYKQTVYEHYGRKNGLSSELTSLISDVTDGKDGDYERVKALSDYLQTMEYNRHPGALPETVTNPSEYLDYLIFQSRKGYCVHYATAMVLLARECGYPARYVQGYAVETRDKSGDIMVTEEDAHSWAEVYFDNFGWVVFEATPGYMTSVGWGLKESSGVKEQIGQSEHTQKAHSSEKMELDEIPTVETKRGVPVRLIVIPVSLVVLFGVLYLLLDRSLTRYRYGRMDDKEKTLYVIRKSIKILKRMGYPLHDFETVQEYRNRVTSELGEGSRYWIFLEIYEKYLYSDYMISEDDVLYVAQGYEELKNIMREKGFRYKVVALFY